MDTNLKWVVGARVAHRCAVVGQRLIVSFVRQRGVGGQF